MSIEDIQQVAEDLKALLIPRQTELKLYRSAVGVVDKIIDFTSADITTADNGAGTGSLLASTTYDMTVIPGNRFGHCKVAAVINTQATAAGANTFSIRLSFGQAARAEWYDICLSDAAAPLWVARVTEAQRAAGDFEVTAVGVVAAGGGNPAGSIDVNVAGTGIASSNAIFAQNNAYTPAIVPAFDSAGYSKAILRFKLVLTDARSAPTLRIIPFSSNKLSGGDWHNDSIYTVALLGGLGQPLAGRLTLDTFGEENISILLETISGQGAAVSIWYSLIR